VSKIEQEINDFIKQLGGPGKMMPRQDLIFCVVVSGAYQAQAWVDTLNDKKIKFDDFKEFLQTNSFKPVSKNTSYKIVIVPPGLMKDGERNEKHAKAIALRILQGLMPNKQVFLNDANLEITLLMRNEFSDQDIIDASLRTFDQILVAQEGLMTSFGKFVPGLGARTIKSLGYSLIPVTRKEMTKPPLPLCLSLKTKITIKAKRTKIMIKTMTKMMTMKNQKNNKQHRSYL
jgi:hypothetical protein